jgi:hypothetical protein
MHTPIESTIASIGFRHVLEDAIILLHGTELDSERRNYVLREIIQLCRTAERGFSLVYNRARLVTGERNVIDCCAFFNRHLNRSTWIVHTIQTRTTLEALLQDRTPQEDSRREASSFLSSLLRLARARSVICCAEHS